MPILFVNSDDSNKISIIKNKKILFFVSLIVVILLENYIIYSVEPIENKIIFTTWILIINSTLSVGVSIPLVLIKKFRGGHFDIKSHTFLAVGLALLLCANIQWLVNELDEIVPDVPSIADIFWLAAYPFLGYSIYYSFKKFYKKSLKKKYFY